MISKDISNLFFFSKEYPIDSFESLIKCLIQLSTDNISIINTNDSFTKLFSTSLLIEITLNNLFRLNKFWEIISSHLLFILKHSNINLRKYSSDCINDIIQLINFEKENEEVQILYLSTFNYMFNIDYYDVKISTLKILSNVINKNGEILTKGWQIILPILNSSCNDIKISSIALKSINMIGI
jgi:hypothetical protein